MESGSEKSDHEETRRKQLQAKKSRSRQGTLLQDSTTKSNDSFQGIIKGVSSINNASKLHKVPESEESRAVPSKSKKVKADKQGPLTKSEITGINLTLESVEYLERYKNYRWGKTASNHDIMKHPSVKFSMSKFRPLFRSGVFPYVEKFVQHSDLDRRVDSHDNCHHSHAFHLLNYPFRPRRHSETSIVYPKTTPGNLVKYKQSFINRLGIPRTGLQKSSTNPKLDISFSDFGLLGSKYSQEEVNSAQNSTTSIRDNTRGGRNRLSVIGESKEVEESDKEKVDEDKEEIKVKTRRKSSTKGAKKVSVVSESEKDDDAISAQDDSKTTDENDKKGSAKARRKSSVKIERKASTGGETKAATENDIQSSTKARRKSSVKIERKASVGGERKGSIKKRRISVATTKDGKEIKKDGAEVEVDNDLEKATSAISVQDILNLDVKTAKQQDGTMIVAPELTWREYKMMAEILRMASFENRDLAQILSQDTDDHSRWKRLKKLYMTYGLFKKPKNKKKDEFFSPKGVLLGKSISETSIVSATRIGVKDYAARLSEEISEDIHESSFNTELTVKKSYIHHNEEARQESIKSHHSFGPTSTHKQRLHDEVVTQSTSSHYKMDHGHGHHKKAKHSPSSHHKTGHHHHDDHHGKAKKSPSNASHKIPHHASDVSLRSHGYSRHNGFEINKKTSSHSTAAQSGSKTSLRSVGGAAHYGLKQRFQRASDDHGLVIDIRREKNVQENRSCYGPETADQTWEWKKARHQEMIRAREAEARRLAYLERRRKMLESLSPEELAKRQWKFSGMYGRMPGGADGYWAQDGDSDDEFGLGSGFNMGYINGVRWSRRGSTDSVYSDYSKKPTKYGVEGMMYVPENMDEEDWIIAENVRMGDEEATYVKTMMHLSKTDLDQDFTTEHDIEMSDLNKRMELTSPASVHNTASMASVVRDKPYQPPNFSDSDELESNQDVEVEEMDPFIKQMLQKPTIDKAFPCLNKIVVGKAGKGGKAKAAKQGKGKALPPPPEQPPTGLCTYDIEALAGEPSETASIAVPIKKPIDPELLRAKEQIRAYQHRENEKKRLQPWLGGRIAFNKQVCRFGLPMDMCDLKTMTPSEYLKNYCFLSDRRARNYLASFDHQISKRKKKDDKKKNEKDDKKQKKAEPAKSASVAASTSSTSTIDAKPQQKALTEEELAKTISFEEIILGVQHVHHNCVTRQQVEDLLDMVKIRQIDIRIEPRLFMALCALTERLYFSKFAMVEDPRMVSGKEAAERLLIEVTDFENLKGKIDGIKLADGLDDLFSVLTAGDVA